MKLSLNWAERARRRFLDTKKNKSDAQFGIIQGGIFKDLRINNIVSKVGDGNKGWIEQKPFDRIIITAATKNINNEIFSQIKDNGIIIAPMICDEKKQILKKFIIKNKKLIEKNLTEVSFVPNLSGIKN